MGRLFAVVNNYRRGDWEPYLLHTSNFGQSWKNIAQKKNIEGYALSFVQDIEEPKLMFLGTENGLYISIDKGKEWAKWTNDYPSVSTYDMVIHPYEHDLVIGTFGRAAYIIDDLRPLRKLANSKLTVLKEPIHVFTPPGAFIYFERQASGTRFSGSAIYSGENRPEGAMISYSISMTEEEEQQPMEKRKKVSIDIIDPQGEIIRHFKDTPGHQGINRLFWNLEREGARRPGAPKPDPDDNLPSGGFVLPGEYTIKMSYEEHISETTIKVTLDPNIEITPENLSEIYQMTTQLISLTKETTALTDQLNMVNKSHKAVSEWISNLKDIDTDTTQHKLYNDILNQGKEIEKATKKLLKQIIPPQNQKQGIVRTPPNTLRVMIERTSFLYTNQFTWNK